jgi:hypothetical protein
LNSGIEDIYTGQVVSKSTSKWSGNVNASKLKSSSPSNFLKDYRALDQAFPRASKNSAIGYGKSFKVDDSA